jgi:hypothetical protein
MLRYAGGRACCVAQLGFSELTVWDGSAVILQRCRRPPFSRVTRAIRKEYRAMTPSTTVVLLLDEVERRLGAAMREVLRARGDKVIPQRAVGQ